MRTVPNVILLLLCAAVLCSCGRSGPVVRPEPAPVELRALPEDKMLPPNFGGQARRILLQPETGQTHGSGGSNGS